MKCRLCLFSTIDMCFFCNSSIKFAHGLHRALCTHSSWNSRLLLCWESVTRSCGLSSFQKSESYPSQFWGYGIHRPPGYQDSASRAGLLCALTVLSPILGTSPSRPSGRLGWRSLEGRGRVGEWHCAGEQWWGCLGSAQRCRPCAYAAQAHMHNPQRSALQQDKYFLAKGMNVTDEKSQLTQSHYSKTELLKRLSIMALRFYFTFMKGHRGHSA